MHTLPNVSTALSLTSGDIIKVAKPTTKGTDNLTHDWVLATEEDYFHKTFSIKCDWEKGVSICLAGIKAKNADNLKPIASCIMYRIKLSDTMVSFNVVTGQNSNKQYVLPTGVPGFVIDTSYIGRPGGEGTTKPYLPYTDKNFDNYDSTTGEASFKMDTLQLKNVDKNSTLQITLDIYIEAGLEKFGWNLDKSAFSDVELIFVGIPND